MKMLLKKMTVQGAALSGLVFGGMLLSSCGGSSKDSTGFTAASSSSSVLSSSLPSNSSSSNMSSLSSSLSTSKNSSDSSVSSAAANYNTAGVQCDWFESANNTAINLTSNSAWTCSSTSRALSANGVPDEEVGTFPNAGNPNSIQAQTVSASYPMLPSLSAFTTKPQFPGYALNGVKFDPATAGGCTNAGTCVMAGGMGDPWNIEAMGQTSFNFGVDANNGHPQPGGAYHYHGVPEKFLVKLAKGNAMTLVGWARDGFPIYARYGYTSAFDAASPIKILKGSYALKATPDANRPSVSLYAMGAFTQDYEYIAGSGDLDECNGRTGVTPEFPNGIYYYALTDSYPFIQRCLKGNL